MASSVQMPIFIITSIGTRMVLAIPPSTTSGDFKRELERAHVNCFPNTGEIKVYGLMQVKQKSCFYHLPNSMPIKYAFQSVKGLWFLHVEAIHASECAAAEAAACVSNGSRSADSAECQKHVTSTSNGNTKEEPKERSQRRNHCVEMVGVPAQLPTRTNIKEKKRKKKHLLGCITDPNGNGCIETEKESTEPIPEGRAGAFASTIGEFGSHSVVETPSSKGSAEVISVTGIIDRYFSNLNELDWHSSPSSSGLTSRANEKPLQEQLRAKTDENRSDRRLKAATTRTPRRISRSIRRSRSPGTLRGQIKGCEVGKRLLVASSGLGVSSISICRYKRERLLKLGCSPVRNMLFEISDRED